MTKAPPSAGRLRKLAIKYANDHSVDVGRVQRWISFMVIGGALGRAKRQERPVFTIKGGVALELRLPHAARATKDLDLVVNGEADIVAELDGALEHAFGGFTFRRKATEHELGVDMLRVEVVLEYLGGSWGTVQVDLSWKESNTTEVDLVPAISLDPFGIPGPDRLPCLSLRHHIAQKIHGMTRPSTRDWANDRERDLVDLLLLEDLGIDLAAVRAACIEVFGARKTHSWPPREPLPENWEGPVLALAAELEMPLASYEDAVARVWAFIERINAAE